MNREEPQSRQTKSLGNTQTEGLSRSLRPLELDENLTTKLHLIARRA
jgi:hypothetical protein